MRTLARELGFLLLFLALGLALAPSVLQALQPTSEGYSTNRLEELFLLQVGFLVLLAIVAALYLVRFLLTLLIRWAGGEAAGGETP